MDEPEVSDAERPDEQDANDQLRTTAADWRGSLRGTEAEDSADEVARGADNAARQRGFGREGS